METYKNRKVLIVGLARSGIAAAKYLIQKGATVTVTDLRQKSELKKEIDSLNEYVAGCRGISYHLGSNPPGLFTESDLVVLSPGVPLDIEGVKLAMENGIPIVCEMELGLNELKGRLIAITGTNGKSTTTELIGELLRGAKKSVWVGGNIGRPLIGDIDKAGEADFVVLEVSSYQLETTPSLKPDIGIWLNATPDHLDRYSSFDDYVGAKVLLGKNQDEGDWIIYNHDDSIVTREIKSFNSRKLPFSISEKLDSGAWYSEDELKITMSELIPRQACPERSRRACPERVCETINTNISKLKGLHNRENIAAASLAAVLCGLKGFDIENSLKKFKGLPHRLQFVRCLNGVSYYNDSKGTNTGAVVKSIESFDSSIVLIAGGQDKNTGYSELKRVVPGRVRCILAIGEAAEKIKDELGDLVDVTICGSLEESVNVASMRSEPGDVVLLSPACASFDMFRDYAERGECFVECVNRLG